LRSVIETVGAFAGIAAILGVAVLSMLVIAQGRDLRRLREWAGGAPERDAELKEVSEVVAEERSEELKLIADREQRRSRRFGEVNGESFWQRLGRSGQIMVVAAAVIIVGAVAAWFINSQGNDSNSGGGGKGGQQAVGRVAPGSVDVAVLNGTGGAEAGLAAEYAAFLESKGFEIGVTADAPEVYTESVVFFPKGEARAAEKVATAIDAPSTELITTAIAELAPDATAVAVIGTNHSDLPSSSG
jgi:hypothetical protein